MSLMSSMKDILWAGDYPPSAFHFKVVLACSLGIADTSFEDVSGIEIKVSTEGIKEGGANDAQYQSMGQITHSNLKLKRGIAPITSPLVLWCQSVFNLEYRLPSVPLPLLVMLMNGDRIPVRVWMFNNALPVAWTVDSFNSTKNSVALETIELSHQGITRVY